MTRDEKLEAIVADVDPACIIEHQGTRCWWVRRR